MVNNFTNKKTFDALVSEGRPAGETIKYLLACEGESVKGIAILADVSATAVSLTIYQAKINKKAVSAISKILGFNPWS